MSDRPVDPDSIVLIVSGNEASPIEGQRGWGDDVSKRVAASVEVNLDPSLLERKMAAFLTTIGRIFRQAEQQMPHLGVQLSEIELSVEIGAKQGCFILMESLIW
jgi:hypothetical protein